MSFVQDRKLVRAALICPSLYIPWSVQSQTPAWAGFISGLLSVISGAKNLPDAGVNFSLKDIGANFIYPLVVYTVQLNPKDTYM